MSETLCRIASAEKASYEKLDHELLAAENLAYTPTHYFTLPTPAGPVPVMVQTYLDPEAYEPHLLSGKEQNRLTSLGVWDLNRGNVRLHRETGRLALLDCVSAWS